MITSPKGVKRKLDKIPKDEGEEQFVSEEDEIGVPPDEADGDPNDEISDRKDNHMTGEGASTGEEDTTQVKYSAQLNQLMCAQMMMMLS